MRICLAKPIGITVFLIATCIHGYGQTSSILAGEFWVELEPVVGMEGASPETPEQQVRILLDEARFVFAGMIYGYRFRYVPVDLRRDVAEEFELTLMAEIKWGDPALQVAESRHTSGRRYVLIRYNVSEDQGAWIRFWESNIHPTSSAYGEGNVFAGREQKYEAINEAVRESIRAYMRTRIYNKPREMSGLVALAEVPYVVITEGTYLARTDVILDVREVVPYKVY